MFLFKLLSTKKSLCKKIKENPNCDYYGNLQQNEIDNEIIEKLK